MLVAEQPTMGRKFEKVCQILDRNGRRPQRLIPILDRKSVV